ncbi:MAG: tetratricopeptide repeat protein [Acidobacteria bacterium]|nr:tetratricopeptide repeat protein [Acidobacteriota bacterium]
MFAGSGLSQTYQLGSGGAANPAQPNQSQSSDQPLGWGSSIQNARLARAAELALQRGDHAVALDYAERAAKAAPNDPQLWFLLGYAARLDGKYGAAIDGYQRGLHLKPSSIDGVSGLAQTYGMMGRTDEAVRLFKQVIAADPGRANDLAALGNLYVRSGDYTGAIEWLNRAERIDPTAQTELLLAVAYEHLKQMDQASHYLALAKSKAPNNPDIERSLAEFYRETGEYQKAVDALNTIRNPRPDVLAELGYTYALDGKLEDSAHYYVLAADAMPKDLGLQLSAAQSQVAIGAIERADRFLARASAIDANYYRLHAIRAEVAQLEDRNEEAVKEYTAAISNLPASPVEGNLYPIQLRMNLVALYQGLDDPDASHQQLTLAESQIAALDVRGPNRAEFLRLRALIRMDAGQLDAALTDMKEALAINPNDPNSLQLDGDLLMKMGHTTEAIVDFKKALALQPKSQSALTSLGYASRAVGDDAAAEKYFTELAADYSKSYIPYLALGDLYTARAQYDKAERAYSRGYALAPQQALLVAGGMNAGIESHDLKLAAVWQERVTPKMESVPQVLSEQERYFSFQGDSRRSATYGEEAIKLLPNERDVVVYLGYDFLHLDEFTQLKDLTTKYEDTFPKDPDIPMLAGYVYKHDGDLEKSVAAFTEALRRDPNVVTAYTNRGYLLDDLHQPKEAAADFEQALKREPKNLEAHMGLAFASLNMNHLQEAIRETRIAEAIGGDSELVHTIRATAYGREGMLTKSAEEYRAALKFDPKDGSLYLALGNIFFAERRYHDALDELNDAATYLPEDASVYALMARSNANLKNREQTLHDIQLAETYAQQKPASPQRTVATQTEQSVSKSDTDKATLSDIYVATGEALSTLGDQKAAMDRFSRALAVPDGNRVSVRYAIAGLMAQQGQTSDAERQIALAQMEADAGDTAPPTGEQDIQAAGILQQLHEYELSEKYLQRAQEAGAPDTSVRIALANSYLALGETTRAAAELAAVKQTDDNEGDYEFLLAEAAVAQQEHHGTEALSTFAQASTDSGEDQTAELQLLAAGANEGLRVTPHFSFLANVIVQPIFEDSTVYVLDAKLDAGTTFTGPSPVASTNFSQLPPPRSSIETDSINAFHLHFAKFPTNSGFFQVRNSQGAISVPATHTVQNRNTTDYIFNFGLDPSFHVGSNLITLNSGIQGTLQRDSLSPVQLNENMFRVFTYFTTTSFFNAVSANGFFTYEFGPFTETPIYGKYLVGEINFRVGAPWSKTALITGWNINDQKFPSVQLGNNEDYFTTSYIGLTHRFGPKFSAEAVMDDVRAWRLVSFAPVPPAVANPPFPEYSGISQAIRPAGTIDFSPNASWDFQATSSYESTRSFHVYDMLQNGFAVSYTHPIHRDFDDTSGKTRLKYPLKFSAGLQEETFINFQSTQKYPNQKFIPYVSITIF